MLLLALLYIPDFDCSGLFYLPTIYQNSILDMSNVYLVEGNKYFMIIPTIFFFFNTGKKYFFFFSSLYFEIVSIVVSSIQNIKKKLPIQDTKHLSTDADRSTDTKKIMLITS